MILLLFDDKASGVLAGMLREDYFDAHYRDIVARGIRFVHTYSAPPKDSLPALLDDKLNSDDRTESQLYRDTLERLYQFKDGHEVQVAYTMRRLEAFVRSRHLRDGVLRAAEILNRSDTHEAMDSVEAILLEASKRRLEVFDAGTRLTDLEKSLASLNRKEGDSLPTGIKHLDDRSATPLRGGLFLFVALAKAGKSWALMHLGKQAMVRRLSVVHITLEMDEASVAMRYIQSMFGVGVRGEVSPATKFDFDDAGNFAGFDVKSMTPSLHLRMPDIKEMLAERIRRRGLRMRGLVIKQFSTGSLTVPQLRAYLDLLADSERVKPDLLIVDYADLMQVGSGDYRLGLGNLYKELRGLAVERGIAVATASQANRVASGRRSVDARHISEDFSKVATADVVITYSQTAAEKTLNLARLLVAANRNDEGGFGICINQHYETGQFALGSIRLSPQYYGLVQDMSGIDEDTE